MAELYTQQFSKQSSDITQARLERAYTLLTQTPQSRNGPITLDQLIKDSSANGCYRRVKPRSRVKPSFIRQGKFIPLPPRVNELASQIHKNCLTDAIHNQFSQQVSNCRSFMGVLPEIHRAWFTIDNKLLLWNYSPIATTADSLTEFLDYNQVILNVGIVKPNPGVFMEHIEYVLVIASFFEICLVSVTFSKRGDYNSIMVLNKTEISISTEHVVFNQIVGSRNGRLFVGGDNGKVYDILYQAENGWITDKIKKVDHYSSYLNMFLPTILERRVGASVKILALDEQRNLLHILRGDNDIEVIYLGKNKDKYIRSKEINGVDITSAVKSGGQVIKSLFVFPYSKSKIAQLVAVTAIGDRIFFSLYNNDNESLTASKGLLAPTTFKVIYVHKENRQNLSILTKFKDVTMESGLTLGVCSESDRVDRIWAMAPSIGEISESPYMCWLEQYDSFDLECDVWKIFPVRPDSVREQGPGVFGDFYGQFSEDKWTFCALTNIGFQFFDVLRPLDQLHELVNMYDDQLKDNYTVFMNTYGIKETLAMLLELACSNSLLWSLEGNDSVYRLVQEASINLFLRIESLAPPINPSISKLPSNNSTTDIAHVTRLNGLLLYISRLFEPFWSIKILSQMSQLFGPPKINEVLKYKRKLEKLCIILEKRIIPNLKITKSTMVEKEYATDLCCFVSKACEILSLFMILRDNNYMKFDTGLTPVQNQYIGSLSFGDLVWTKEGISLIQNILTMYIRNALSLGQNVSGRIITDFHIELIIGALEDKFANYFMKLTSLEKLFRNSCPNIYTQSSKIFSRGWNKIVRASELPESSSQRNKLLEESAQIFKNEIVDMQASQFLQIVDEYKSLLFYKGIVDMTVSWAKRNSSSLFIANETTGKHDDLNDEIDCLEIIKTALMSIKSEYADSDINNSRRADLESEKNGILKSLFFVQNKAFLFKIYPLLVKELTEEVFKAQPPFLEEFLLTMDDTKEKHLLLARHYFTNQIYPEAAISYSNIAETFNCDIDERIKYLTHSIFSWRLTPNKSIADDQLMEDTLILLNIAIIQKKILEVLKQRPDVEVEVCNNLRTRVFDLSDLYNNFVVPFSLTELAREIGNLSVSHSAVC